MRKIGLMVMFLAVCLCVASLAVAAGGGNSTVTTPVPAYNLPSNMWMLTSSKALESYAKEQVVQAASYGGSQGIVLPGGRTWAQVVTNNPDIRVIQQLLGQQVLSFRVADPEACQYLGAQLMDAYGYGLFWGWNSFQLQKDRYGTWQVPPGASSVEAQMTDPLPICVPGVSSAYALVTDENGNQQYVNLQVQNDHVFYPMALAGLAEDGWAGQIVLTVGNNSAVYDMGSGANVPTTLVESGVQAGIGGLVTLDNPNHIFSNPQSINGQGVNPMYQIKISGTKSVNLFGMTSEGEVATGVFVRGTGGEPVYCPITPGQMLHLTFDAATDAVWDIWFVYPIFGADNSSIPPNNGGGMG